MALPSIDDKNLMQTIDIAYQTLKKLKTRTLELQQRNNRTLEETEKHVLERQNRQQLRNSERFSDSISFIPNHKAPTAIPRRQSCSALQEHLVKREAQADSTAYHGVQKTPSKSRILPGTKTPQKSKLDGGSKKNDLNKQTLGKIIFRTLDTLFHVNNTARQHSHRIPTPRKNDSVQQPNMMGLDTLRKLAENTPDTLPRNRTSSETSFTKDITVNAKERKNVSHVLTTSTPLPLAEISNANDENAWNSSDNESWMYIPTPLKYEEAVIDSSLDCTQSNPIRTETNILEMPKDSRQFRKNRNSKKLSGKENKIQKRIVDRHAPKPEKRKENLHPVKIPRAKIHRPDSPVLKVKELKPSQTVSLPNLTEESYDTLRSIASIGTNSFLRDIALRPSSTLSKSVPCISVITEGDNNDDDSASSSFSSFQILEDDNKTPYPSALCNNIDVMPIDVHIAPWKTKSTEAEDNIGSDVKKLKRSFTHADETLEQTRVITPFLKQQLVIQETIDEVTYEQISNHSQPPVDNTLVEFQPDDELKVVLNEFSWMETHDSGTKSEQSQTVSNDNNIFCQISSCKKDNKPNSDTSIPPPPPPLPMDNTNPIGTYRALQNLPLPVFTHPQPLNTVFTNLESIAMEDKAMKRLKENYSPKKSKSIAAKLLSLGKDWANPAKPNYKLNMEIFLKKWGIINLDEVHLKKFLEAVRTLHVDSLNSCLHYLQNGSTDSGCISSLIQVVSKLDGMDQPCKSKKIKLNKADSFISDLVSIPRLKEKLGCIQFVIDFNESSNFLLNQIELFVDACTSINSSKKFIDILKLVMSLLNHLNSGGTKIYGFDIRGLCKLATNTFHDGTTTLLHFLIEYISSEPSLKDAINFYKDFRHLSDVSKTFLKDLEEEFINLKTNEAAFTKELELIRMEHERENKSSRDLDSVTISQKKVQNVVKILCTKLETAKNVFHSCKERYGLASSDITEVEFFKSLSDFINAYQKIHAEIMDQSNTASYRSSVPPPRSEPAKPAHSKLPVIKRKSLGATRVLSQNTIPKEKTNPSDELDNNCLLKFLEDGGRGKRRDRKPKKV